MYQTIRLGTFNQPEKWPVPLLGPRGRRIFGCCGL